MEDLVELEKMLIMTKNLKGTHIESTKKVLLKNIIFAIDLLENIIDNDDKQ
jgi:hypothetical protein